MKPTTGPYYAHETGNGVCPYMITNNPQPDRNFAIGDVMDQADPAETKANAVLLAAAWDLLQALKGLVRTECPIVTHHRVDCQWCAGLRAIAKAGDWQR